MGPALLHSLIGSWLLFSSTPPPDTATFADRATQELVARAAARHREQDSTVQSYTAKIRYRVSFSFARRKWGDPLPVAVEEQEATIAWQLPNDLRVNLLGRRSASQLQGVDLSSTFSHPWFVPRTLGDSLRIFGASQTPDRAAPHPLAPGAEQYYRYAAGDSIVMATAGRRITVQVITITPKRADGAFVAGRMWVDVRSGDVVRFTFRFVGTQLWNSGNGTAGDSASDRKASQFVSRVLELNADLEYALQNGSHWLPYRQTIAGKVTVPLGVDFAVPFEAQTTFDDYDVNNGTPVVFDAPFPRDTTARGRNGGRLFAGGRGGPPPRRPDSLGRRPDSLTFRLRARNRTGYLAGGGRYEIHRPPADSMRRYNGWGDSLVLDDQSSDHQRVQQAMTDLARLTDKLPRAMTGRPGVGFGWEKVSDVLRYNRVEGTTLAAAGHLPVPLSFSDVYGTLRYGFGDERIMARLALVRDAPRGRLTVAVSRDLRDTDPYTDGLSLGNSLRGILTGHDDGAYLLGQGGSVRYETSHGRDTDISWGATLEDETSVTNHARAFVPRITGDDGYFGVSTPARDGLAATGLLRVQHDGPVVHWLVDMSGGAVGGAGAGRIATELRFPSLLGRWVSARLKAGLAIGVDSVPQFALRAGGLNTVRGYDFARSSGDMLWATQVDVSRPTQRRVKLIGFADAGQAGFRNHFGDAPFLSSVGVGISVLGGLIRADLSQPLTATSGRGPRFDLTFGSIR